MVNSARISETMSAVSWARVPVEPSQNFVRDLGQSLTAMASQQRMPFRQRYGRAIMFGIAAAGSVVSVVSVGAYWYYRRESHSNLEQS